MQIIQVASVVAMLASYASAQGYDPTIQQRVNAMHNYENGNSDETVQQRMIEMHERQMGITNGNMAPPDYNAQIKNSFTSGFKGVKSKFGMGHKQASSSAGRCGKNKMSSKDMPMSYNDKSTGFFVDMGMILSDYYGVTAKMSKLQMNSVARTFVAPVHSYSKAQEYVSTTDLYNSVIGLLNILIDHNVNDTFVSAKEWSESGINRRVFSEVQVNDLLRTRSRLLRTAQDRDNGSQEVINKDTAVRKLQLQLFKAKNPATMNQIIADGVDWRQYRTRFAQYMWNICAHTQDRDTIRQVRNHFAFWLASGHEDQASEEELTATYSDTGNPSSFFYPEGLKFSWTSALYTLLGAAFIGVFLSV